MPRTTRLLRTGHHELSCFIGTCILQPFPRLRFIQQRASRRYGRGIGIGYGIICHDGIVSFVPQLGKLVISSEYQDLNRLHMTLSIPIFVLHIIRYIRKESNLRTSRK
jgi:hypothetical protein